MLGRGHKGCTHQGKISEEKRTHGIFHLVTLGALLLGAAPLGAVFMSSFLQDLWHFSKMLFL